ncbi:MAG: alkaline phosphatase family protein [Massilibacteroides sp.]|nr:alkaline phosphatase family protein [Massilibacteroides sp.]MDD3063971.1 alkaline phosphatase family protein [Massilibacteroides sp.]MDD4114773.1 alkaline phosphatase family protein [Massilibacteroides sp.]MDD4661473.1 alkaline phosphatase family protein [Massilibacteroides sp.]
MNKIRNISFILGFCLLCLSCKDKTNKLPSGIKHVFVLGIDAMSTQGMETASTPNIDYLIKNGAICRNVRTVIPSSSSPNWASMLAGAGVEAHGITSNSWTPDNYSVKPVGITEYGMFPTIVSVVRKQLSDAKIGMIYHWNGFGNLFEKNVANVDKSYETQQKTAQALSDYIRTEKPTFTFTQLDDVDHYGHMYGHMTEKYLACIEQADQCVGMVLKAVKDAGIENESLIIVVADHGGIGYSHGGESWEEMTVPFILYGKNINKGFEIQQQTYIFDVAPTIAYALGIDVPYAWTGRPIRSAFEGETSKADPVMFKHLSYGPRINGRRNLFEQAGGLFVDKTEVTIEPYTKGDKVYYTTDGSEPTQKSLLYQAPFQLNQTTVLKAKSFGKGNAESVISVGYFRFLHRNPDNGINVNLFPGTSQNHMPLPQNGQIGNQWIADEIRADEKQINQLLPTGQTEFSLVFSSYIQIDKSGEYYFYLQSDDGSRLYIDDKKVVDNGGSHGVTEKSGSVILEKGRHSLTIDFYNDGGGYWIDAYYKGPGIPKQIIPAEKLFKKP